MRVVGLGFKAEADGRSVSPDSMFIVQVVTEHHHGSY